MLILPAYRSTMLMACMFVIRDTVRHPRRFVFGKFVRKPNCSWSKAFVNRGLSVQLKLEIENVGSFMLFTKYKTATFALPWVWNVWLNVKVKWIYVSVHCAGFCSLLLGVSGAEIQHTERRHKNKTLKHTSLQYTRPSL